MVQHSDSLSRIVGENDRNDIRLCVYVMSVGHVDEIMLVVFESDGCSFLELLGVIDINKIVVLHLLMARVR